MSFKRLIFAIMAAGGFAMGALSGIVWSICATSNYPSPTLFIVATPIGVIASVVGYVVLDRTA